MGLVKDCACRKDMCYGNSSWTDSSISPGIVMHVISPFFPLATEHDTDSDSDLSLEDDQSGSYASTHSSDSEEDEEFAREPCWENLLCPNNEKMPAHSTPKGTSGSGFGRVQEKLSPSDYGKVE